MEETRLGLEPPCSGARAGTRGGGAIRGAIRGSGEEEKDPISALENVPELLRRAGRETHQAVTIPNGLPVAVGIASGQRNEQKLVVETPKARFINPLPKRLIGDKAYDSDPLDAELAGMASIAAS